MCKHLQSIALVLSFCSTRVAKFYGQVALQAKINQRLAGVANMWRALASLDLHRKISMTFYRLATSDQIMERFSPQNICVAAMGLDAVQVFIGGSATKAPVVAPGKPEKDDEPDNDEDSGTSSGHSGVDDGNDDGGRQEATRPQEVTSFHSDGSQSNEEDLPPALSGALQMLWSISSDEEDSSHPTNVESAMAPQPEQQPPVESAGPMPVEPERPEEGRAPMDTPPLAAPAPVAQPEPEPPAPLAEMHRGRGRGRGNGRGNGRGWAAGGRQALMHQRWDIGFGFIKYRERASFLDAHCGQCRAKIDRKSISHPHVGNPPQPRHRARGRPLGVMLLWLNYDCQGNKEAHKAQGPRWAVEPGMRWPERCQLRSQAMADPAFAGLWECERDARPDEKNGEPFELCGF